MSLVEIDKDVSLETVDRCLVCSSTEHTVVFEARDTLHHLPGVWTVRRCLTCGHGFTSPRPDRGSISRFYPEDYQPFSSPIAPAPGSWLHQWLKSVTGRLLDPREIVVPPCSPGKALEVGCGSGRLLSELARRGWGVRGLEPSETAAARAESALGIPVDSGTIETADYPAEEFDLIAALMVLEHLHDPLEDARRIASWLCPGGWFMGSVPNCGSWEFRAFESRWYALQVPTHLSHFTSDSLTRLLVETGFEPPRIIHQRNVSNLMVQLGRVLERRSWPGARVCLDYPERGPRSLRLATWPVATLLAAIRQAGRISFITRRLRCGQRPPTASDPASRS